MFLIGIKINKKNKNKNKNREMEQSSLPGELRLRGKSEFFSFENEEIFDQF